MDLAQIFPAMPRLSSVYLSYFHTKEKPLLLVSPLYIPALMPSTAHMPLLCSCYKTYQSAQHPAPAVLLPVQVILIIKKKKILLHPLQHNNLHSFFFPLESYAMNSWADINLPVLQSNPQTSLQKHL